jgi:hypothetical protein
MLVQKYLSIQCIEKRIIERRIEIKDFCIKVAEKRIIIGVKLENTGDF